MSLKLLNCRQIQTDKIDDIPGDRHTEMFTVYKYRVGLISQPKKEKKTKKITYVSHLHVKLRMLINTII